jgi:uracil-DNA glycosylase
MPDEPDLAALLARVRACRQCRDAPDGKPLGHEPRPVLRASTTARILIAGQAPGARVHASGAPFTDPSGDRLRDWLGVTSDEFYDESRIAIVPMGFCYPGTDARGADHPPRPECRRLWHDAAFQTLPPPQLILCIGQYAIDYHFHRLGLGQFRKASMTQIVADWRAILAAAPVPLLVLPHPSWRNNGWIRKNPLFEQDILPYLRQKVRAILDM